MILPEMTGWAAKNTRANLEEGAARATIFVADDLIPRALTIAVGIKEGTVRLAEGARNRTARTAKTAFDGVIESIPQERFDRMMNVIAPLGGVALIAKEKVDSLKSRINERRTK